MKSLLPLVLVGLCACGGRAFENDGGQTDDTGTDAFAEDAVAGDAGTTDVAAPPDSGADCGQPTHTVYSCPPAKQPGTCHRYGGPGDTAPADAAFAVGCTVTLPVCSPYYMTPEICNCGPFPSPKDAGPQWTCPL